METEVNQYYSIGSVYGEFMGTYTNNSTCNHFLDFRDFPYFVQCPLKHLHKFKEGHRYYMTLKKKIKVSGGDERIVSAQLLSVEEVPENTLMEVG